MATSIPNPPAENTDPWYSEQHAFDLAVKSAIVALQALPAGVVLVYSSGAYPDRPAVPAGLATYKGPTQPTTWLTGDTWMVA